jgi:hypothetical protein
MTDQKTYSIEIAGVKRDLRLFEIKPGLRIAILNILGDTELVQASARGLAEKVKSRLRHHRYCRGEVHPHRVCSFGGDEEALCCSS